MSRRRHQQSNKYSRDRPRNDQHSRGGSWRRKSPRPSQFDDDFSRGRGYADSQDTYLYADQHAFVPHNYSPLGGLEFDDEPLQQYPQQQYQLKHSAQRPQRRPEAFPRSRSPRNQQRFKGNGRRSERNTKNNTPTSTWQRRRSTNKTPASTRQLQSTHQFDFKPGDFVQMGNGSVAKVVGYGDGGKSRRIQFKHKVYNRFPYGHYFGRNKFRKWQAELIDEAQYDAVPSNGSFVSPAASPAPSVASISPSPSPEPITSVDLKVSRNIRFKEEKSAQGEEDDAADTISDDQKMEIRIDTERAPDAVTVHAESDSVEAPSSEVDVDVEIDEMEPGQTKSPGSTSKKDADAPDVPAVEYEQVEGAKDSAAKPIFPASAEQIIVAADDGEHAEDAKEPEPEPKAEMLPIFKRPKDTVGAKFAKKMKKLYRVSDKRERAFLLMCDESKMVDLQSMCDYIAHFGGAGVKVRKKTARGFFESMKPNARSLVSFSKFVKAVDENGDVVAAYERFKASRTSRSRKN